ncbi:Zinc finger C2H2-type [Cinara cedri]|uniref:Zinc finger C2H2-type n=1 Tax=Cinara cedri TaxID=506608 RepID=A0A5E4NSR6_9HEMI|nr:Zinc finger C2H2-type [Cinara cedri]
MSSKTSKKFECNECKKTFSKRNNLNDHVSAKHSNEEKYICSVCKRAFSYKQSFNRHMNIHKLAIPVYSCSECGYSSQLKFMLTRHIKNVHMNENDGIFNVSCVFCDHQCSKSNLSTHYVLCHQTEITSEKLKFDSLDAFFTWKYEVEDQDISRFVKARSTYVGASGSKHLFFKCHRDGKYKPKGKNIRKLKSLGTNKIGSHCPARMDVMVEGNLVSVLYIKTHVGHDLEPKRLTLAKNEKDFLAEQLLIPNTKYNDILNAVKTLDSTSRLHHLTRKDLVAIKNSLKDFEKKNNFIKISENNNQFEEKPNDTIEVKNVFDSDLVTLYNIENHEKSSLILSSENLDVETKSDKQDIVIISNNLLSNHIDIKDSYANKVDPMYELNVDQQIIEQNEQIPILQFNHETLENNQVIDYQQEFTNIQNERLSIMEKMKLIVNQITCNDEFAIVNQGLINIMTTIDERRNVIIDQAVVNGDLDNIMIFDESILQK